MPLVTSRLAMLLPLLAFCTENRGCSRCFGWGLVPSFVFICTPTWYEHNYPLSSDQVGKFGDGEERRNRCDLIEVFKMFYGYTEIDIRVLFTLEDNDKGLRGHSKKIYKPRFNTNIRKYFSQIESLTDGTVWTGTLLMHPA